MSLYREFRPRALSEMTGQSSIIKTIRNQIETQNISHAYLFSGPRGIGKTSIAKILSRAVNCERYEGLLTGEYKGEIPCNECQTCKDILQDMSMDVIEMDAASNNGVDDIRAINDMVKFPPASARYKVIIIDEVHMLSKSAFNALLKTLEEPPSYIIFILATTEVNRIPATVLSRCQRYDFKKMTQEELIERLEYVCKSLNRQYDIEALKLIASRSEGAMRDALSILDQCLSYSEHLSEESVLYSLSLVSEAFLLDLFIALNDSALSKILTLLRSANANGFDPKLLLDDLAQFLNRLIRYVIEKKSDKLHPDSTAYMDAHLQQISLKKLIYFQQRLIFSSSEIKFSSNIWIAIECLFLDMASFIYEFDVRSLEMRVEELEQKINRLEQLPSALHPKAELKSEWESKSEFESKLKPVSVGSSMTPATAQTVNSPVQIVDSAVQIIESSIQGEFIGAKAFDENEVLKLLLDGIPRKLPHLYLPIKHASITVKEGVLLIGIASEYDFMVPTLNTSINVSEILKLLKGIEISDVKFDYKQNITAIQEHAHRRIQEKSDKHTQEQTQEMMQEQKSQKQQVDEFFKNLLQERN